MNLWQRFRHMVVHRRLPLFWTVAVVGVVGPWALRVPLSADVALANGRQTSCEVASVHDGDTMTLRCPGRGTIKVRLYCIDAPEIEQAPWGRRSTDHIEGLAGPTVRLVDHGRGRWGRVIGQIFTPAGVNVNRQMVADGWASVYPNHCNAARYYRAQDSAREMRLGVWSEPGAHQRPWDWRRRN